MKSKRRQHGREVFEANYPVSETRRREIEAEDAILERIAEETDKERAAMEPRLTYSEERERFEYRTDGPNDRFRPKMAGFRYGGTEWPNLWWTEDVSRAAKLRDEATLEAAARIEADLAERAADFDLSSAPEAATNDVPRPDGLEYLPFQKVGIAYAMKRFGDR